MDVDVHPRMRKSNLASEIPNHRDSGTQGYLVNKYCSNTNFSVSLC